MNAYIVQEQTLTTLADGVRNLTGKTEKIDLYTINRDVASTKDEMGTQSQIIEQIKAALQDKTAPSGGVELPDLTSPATESDVLYGMEFIDENGVKKTGSIPTRSASNLTSNGSTVVVPAGYYSSQATKSVETATQATPTINIDANGKITSSAVQTAGYVNAGTKSATPVQMATQAAKTVTPTNSSQTAVAKNVYTTGVITVAAIPDQYQDITTPLAELNAMNGSTEATTIDAAVEQTETLVASEADIISDIITALEGKAAGGSGNGDGGVYTGDLYVLGTATVTPASGVSQIQYTNIPKEPDFFVVYLDTCDINQYHRAGVVVYDGEMVYGQEYYSGTNECNFYENSNSASSYRWRYTYSGTTLTIASYNNSQGGYFHNPGVYTIVYGYKDNENGTVDIGKKKVTSTGGNSLAFTGLEGEPVWYSAILRGNQDAQAASANCVVFANEKGYSHMTNATNAQYAFNATTTHSTYANGTLTINPGTSVFSANEYALTYAYQPSLNTGSAGSSSIFTTTARVTANNQAISFTGLSAQPKAFAIIPRGNITLSTSNRFVVNVNYDGTTMSGVYCYGSGSAYNASYTAGYSAAYFTQTYNNGTLTITTSSTTNGGYFAANVDYALIAIC